MSDLPKVSGVLAVGYGDRYFRVAAAAFLASTYEGEMELIILDNNEDPIESLIPDDPRVRYYHCTRMPVGALRNLGASYATGDILISLDEDDWSHPDRVSVQVERLATTGRSVTGFHAISYLDTSDGRTYQYHYDPNRPHLPYACGSSQCYTKAWWESHKYPETGIEDFAFQAEALRADQLDSIDGRALLVARAHHDSVCHPTQLGTHRQFPAVAPSTHPPEFFAAITPKVAAKPKRSKATGE
jgi:glycosyltransferase involved in cell wall biosynthesis